MMYLCKALFVSAVFLPHLNGMYTIDSPEELWHNADKTCKNSVIKLPAHLYSIEQMQDFDEDGGTLNVLLNLLNKKPQVAWYKVAVNNGVLHEVKQGSLYHKSIQTGSYVCRTILNNYLFITEKKNDGHQVGQKIPIPPTIQNVANLSSAALSSYNNPNYIVAFTEYTYTSDSICEKRLKIIDSTGALLNNRVIETLSNPKPLQIAINNTGTIVAMAHQMDSYIKILQVIKHFHKPIQHLHKLNNIEAHFK